MASKKKNSNYVTEKTIAAKAAKADVERKKKLKKKLVPIIAIAVAVAVIVGAVFAIGVPLGMLDYRPEATNHVNLEFEGYTGSVHIELYGSEEDAPKTVKHFIDSIKRLEGKPVRDFKDGLLYFGERSADNGPNGLTGEFSENNVDNRISIRRGVIAAARGEDYNSGGTQYFIATENATELNGKYAAFAKIISGMSIIEEIIEDLEFDDEGNIINAPVIKSISTHDAH